MSSETEIRPFRVDMPEEAITDLRQRIAAMRWPSKELVADRSQGVQLATLQELARYWATGYDWRACEETLNTLPMFKTEIDAVDVHFIHVKSPHENALPLIMTHGWPGSIIEMLGAAGPLTDPSAHGGSAEDAFDLVVPSIPGYGFPPYRPRSAGTSAAPRRHPHLFQRSRPGRPLRRLGRARRVHDRGPGGVQAATLTADGRRQTADGSKVCAQT